MDTSNVLKIDGEKFLLFMSENVKRLFLKSKVNAKSILTNYAKKEFTSLGVCHYENVGKQDICILNIKAIDIENDKPIKCFVLNCLGNYTDLKPVRPNKWSVKLKCGHIALIDDTVDTISSDHSVKCFKCEGKDQ